MKIQRSSVGQLTTPQHKCSDKRGTTKARASVLNAVTPWYITIRWTLKHKRGLVYFTLKM